MDWLKNFTKNWQLKYSFLAYELASLIFSIPLGFLFQTLLLEVRRDYMVKGSLDEIPGLFYSDFFKALIDIVPLAFMLAFFFVAFALFYRHKIRPVILYLDTPEASDLNDRNELSDKVFSLRLELERLEKDNMANAQAINEVSKHLDTLLHEIKNPLAVLSGDIEMLESLYDFEDDGLNQMIDRMERNKERINSYVNSLELNDNIKNIEINKEPIYLGEFITRIKEVLDDYHKTVEFNCTAVDLEQTVNLDLRKFSEGLVNILKNSETYAQDRIALDIYEDGDYVVVDVQDDGPGFSKEALENYNKAYFSENPLFGNLGLGLYITDNLMKKQGIKMKLRNRQGANTKLFIEKS